MSKLDQFKVYMLDYGRPTEIAPEIYEFNPYKWVDNKELPLVVEFPNELSARHFYKEHYPERYKFIEVVRRGEIGHPANEEGQRGLKGI